jgi:hypothetical protein
MSRSTTTREVSATKRALAALELKRPAEQARGKQVASKPDVWHVLNLTNVISTGGSGYTNLADGRSWDRPEPDL